jgi:acyl-CoA thioester hydrolase
MAELKVNLAKFKHRMPIHIRYMDIDSMQHVNNARYLNYLEEARIAYSQEVLNLYHDLTTLNVVVARIEIDFKKPLFFGQCAEIYTRVARLGNKSFQFESLIVVQEKGRSEIAARALQTIVAFDPGTQSSVPVPEEIKEKIKAFEE